MRLRSRSINFRAFSGSRFDGSLTGVGSSCAGDWLGEEHDLAVLSSAVRRDGRTLDVKSKERFQAGIVARRTKLQRKALRLGRMLYSRKARDVVK